MQMVNGLYRLARPFNALSGALSVFLGGYVAGTGNWGPVWLAALATVLITASSNAWNDYLDIEIDRINQPQRPLPAGLISPRTAVIFSLACTGLSLLLAAAINPTAFWVALFSNILLYVYSWQLKSTVLLGNAAVALVSAASAVFGGIAAGNPQPSLWLFAVIFTAIMMREVLKTMADYDGDAAQQVKTVATVWGKQPARLLFTLLAVATAVVMLLPFLVGGYRPVYAIILCVGVYPVLLYILMRVRQDSTGPQLEQLSQIIKYDFLVWFVAVAVGAVV